MNITEIHIDGFGKWQNKTFPVNPQLQVFYGENEAGKTTIQKFISSVLFGFATAKHPAEQYLPKTGAGYGGSLTFTVDDAQQTQYRLRRTSGKNGGDIQLTNLTTNQAMPPELLNQLLGPVDRTLNDATFNFDLSGLQLLTTVTQPELMAKVQRVGAVGSTSWIELAEQFDKDADDLYRPRGQKPALNQQLTTYHDLQAQLKAAEAGYPDFVKRQHDILSGKQKVAQLGDHIKELTSKRDELARIKQLWPVFEKYRDMSGGLPDVNEKLITAEDYADFLKLQTQREQLMQTSVRQVAQLKDQTTETPQEVQFYIDHQSAFKSQAASFDQIETAIHERQYSRQQVAEQSDERDQIVTKHRFNAPWPTPLSDSEYEQVSRLTQVGQQQVTNGSKTREQWLMMGVGLVLLLLGLIMSSGVKWLFVLLGIAGIAGGWFNVFVWFRAQQAHGTVATKESSISELTQRHHMAGFPVGTWLALQPDIQRLNQLTDQIDSLKSKIQQLNADINHFFEGYQFAETQLPLTNLSAADALLKARQYTSAKELAVATVQGQSQQRLQLIRDNSDLQAKLSEITTSLQQVMQRYRVQTPNDFENLYQQQLQLADQTAERRALGNQLTPAWLAKLSSYQDIAAVNQRQAEVTTNLQSDIEQRDQVQEDIANQQALFARQSEDDTMPILRQRLANMETKLVETAQQWLVNRLSAQWIDGALNAASADRLPAIVKRAQTYFATLTLEHYTKIEFINEALTVTTSQGTVFDVTELSRGTAEQLYIALRLGFASVMADRTAMPLIIDDAFVDFDRHRKHAMFNLMKELSQEVQVIYFTADAGALSTFDDNQITEL